jgi:hypothetical protein
MQDVYCKPGSICAGAAASQVALCDAPLLVPPGWRGTRLLTPASLAVQEQTTCRRRREGLVTTTWQAQRAAVHDTRHRWGVPGNALSGSRSPWGCRPQARARRGQLAVPVRWWAGGCVRGTGNHDEWAGGGANKNGCCDCSARRLPLCVASSPAATGHGVSASIGMDGVESMLGTVEPWRSCRSCGPARTHCSKKDSVSLPNTRTSPRRCVCVRFSLSVCACVCVVQLVTVLYSSHPSPFILSKARPSEPHRTAHALVRSQQHFFYFISCCCLPVLHLYTAAALVRLTIESPCRCRPWPSASRRSPADCQVDQVPARASRACPIAPAPPSPNPFIILLYTLSSLLSTSITIQLSFTARPLPHKNAAWPSCPCCLPRSR